jgi:carbon-monoxide dehydrogenase large subunit
LLHFTYSSLERQTFMAFSARVGARVKRKEDPRLITGAGQYTGNLSLPGMAYVAFVRSPYAHANIKSIDVSAARARAGVLAAFTGAELITTYGPMPMEDAGEDGSRTHYPISVGRVRYAGEIVAVVVADSPATAADAVDDVLVDWEPLTPVVDMRTALAPDAPVLFAGMENNIAHMWTRKHGEVEQAFAQAARVVTLSMNSQRLAGVAMETRAVLAAPDPFTNGLTLWTGTQSAHGIRGELAKILNLPENSVRVIAPDVGGGFGIKIGLFAEDAAVAALALRLKKPLRWVEGRIESMLATTHGRGQLAEVSAAVQADGQVTGLRVRVTGDFGAYPRTTSIIDLTGLMAVGVYNIPAVDLELTGVFTNTTPIAAYRGAGRPEAAYYIERLMDAIAAELNLEPTAVRRRNFIPPEAFPLRTASGFKYDSGEYEKALNKALEISDYAALRAEQKRRLAEPGAPLLGIGLATYVEMCAFGYDSALVRAEPSGTVTALTGISPHGQGQHTTFAQMVADQLGVDFDKVIVKHGDTALTPMGQGTMGSRGLVVGGSALVRATDKVKAKAMQIAAHMLEAAVEDLELKEALYQVKGVPSKGVTFTEIAERAYGDLPKEIEPGLEATDYFRLPDSTCPFGAHVAVVEVERETGEVRLLNYFSVDDCGPRFSPMLVEGQVHGGLAQGIGQALLEEMAYDAGGQALTGSLIEYAMPRAATFSHFTLDETVTPSPTNPLGAKGIGEAATIGSTPALVNAVVDALRPFGVKNIDMPLKPERVWRALQSA